MSRLTRLKDLEVRKKRRLRSGSGDWMDWPKDNRIWNDLQQKKMQFLQIWREKKKMKKRMMRKRVSEFRDLNFLLITLLKWSKRRSLKSSGPTNVMRSIASGSVSPF